LNISNETFLFIIEMFNFVSSDGVFESRFLSTHIGTVLETLSTRRFEVHEYFADLNNFNLLMCISFISGGLVSNLCV